VSNIRILGLGLLVLQTTALLAQTATPTSNVLTRMTMVQSRYGRGTIFSIDVDGREYWITAKHIITGAEHPPYGSITATTESLEILNPGSPGEQWLPLSFSVIDTEKDVDIVVLAAPKPLLANPLPSVTADSQGAFFGGDCEFLGFPYGGGWRGTFTGPNGNTSFWMPFAKHCTVSAITAAGSVMTDQDKRMWVLDGINNAGFSGGPVIFRTGPEQKIMAVVSGYITEPTAVNSSAQRKRASKKPKPIAAEVQHKQTVNVNSGFILAFDISYAISAIQKNPVGPLRQAK
jgi:hypothetical protein